MQGLFSMSAGNALFLSEAIKAMQERSGGKPLAVALESVQPLGHSQRVSEIIQERMERLPDAALHVLQMAAVIGRDFSLELLERGRAF